MEALTAVDALVLVAGSTTLHATSSAYFSTTSTTFPLTLFRVVMHNSSVVVANTSAIGQPLGVRAGYAVGVYTCALVQVTTTFELRSISSMGGLLLLGLCNLTNATVTVEALSNMTVPPGYPNTVVDVFSTAISDRSTVQVILPLELIMTGASSFAAIMLISVTVHDESAVSIVTVDVVGVAIEVATQPHACE
jgi:hypothetical protein